MQDSCAVSDTGRTIVLLCKSLPSSWFTWRFRCTQGTGCAVTKTILLVGWNACKYLLTWRRSCRKRISLKFRAWMMGNFKEMRFLQLRLQVSRYLHAFQPTRSIVFVTAHPVPWVQRNLQVNHDDGSDLHNNTIVLPVSLTAQESCILNTNSNFHTRKKMQV
jgi:hypothetical protein